MEENKFIRYCKICAENKNDSFGMTYHVPGYINTSIFKLQDNKCLMGHDTIKLPITCEDYEVLTHISINPNFIATMIKLYEDNLVDYELKLSQFRTQVEQQKSSKAQNNNIPKCPTCGSTNIEKISLAKKAFGGAMFGLFSSDVRNTMHCKNCGVKW